MDSADSPEPAAVSVAARAAAPVPAAPGKPLTQRQRRRIARAVERAEHWTGLEYCVYLGPTEEDPRAHALRMLAELGLTEQPAVLLLVAPAARRLEIVMGRGAAMRIDDRAARLAALAMSASFAVGDVAGGITEGIRLLAQAAGPGVQVSAELPDLLDATR